MYTKNVRHFLDVDLTAIAIVSTRSSAKNENRKVILNSSAILDDKLESDLVKPAVVAIDMINDFVSETEITRADEIVRNKWS